MHVRGALLVLVALSAPGCFVTRAIGLGPDPGPNEVARGDTPEEVYAKAQRLFEERQWAEAADAFHALWNDHPKSPLASDAQFYEAESRYGQGKYNGAFELYKRYMKDRPLSAHAPLIQRRIYDIGVYLIEAGRQAFFDYAGEGVDALDYLVSAFPHGDLADDALIYMADYEWKARQTREAIQHLHDLVDDYPTSKWALEARLRLAKAYRDVNRGASYDADALQRAAAEYRTYIERVTADRARAAEYAPQIEEARSELAEVEELLAQKHLDASDFYLRSGNVDSARAELKNVVRKYPKSQAADEARQRLGESSEGGEK
jgi:outer membrane assembly lipoprotein YfiO